MAEQNRAQRIIKRWGITGLLFASFYTLTAVWLLLDSSPAKRRGNELAGFIHLVIVVVSLLFWAGTILTFKKRPTAGALFKVGGILGLPLGYVMYNGGKRVTNAVTLPVERLPIDGFDDGDVAFSQAWLCSAALALTPCVPPLALGALLGIGLAGIITNYLDGNQRKGFQWSVMIGSLFACSLRHCGEKVYD